MMVTSFRWKFFTAAFIFLSSLLSLPILMYLNNKDDLTGNSLNVFFIGVGCLFFVGCGSYFCFGARSDSTGSSTDVRPTFSLASAFFTCITFTAAIDLLLSSSLVGATNLGKFYFDTGEEYFKNSWGFWILLWDGTGHYVLQFYLAYGLTIGIPKWKTDFIGLIWCGSIINSMPVLLLGAATGYHSSDIKPSTALNAPYIIIPVMYLFHIISSSSSPSSSNSTSSTSSTSKQVKKNRDEKPLESRNVSISSIIIDFIYLMYHGCAIVLHVWRAMVVLGSKMDAVQQWGNKVERILLHYDVEPNNTSYGHVRIQVLQFVFYFVPFHCYSIYHLLFGKGDSRLAQQLSLVFLGAYLQAQVGYVGPSFFVWKNFEHSYFDFDLPYEFWSINFALVLFPIFYAIRLM